METISANRATGCGVGVLPIPLKDRLAADATATVA